ncbi:MAG: DsbA family protein [Paracoccaceae bacterium]
MTLRLLAAASLAFLALAPLAPPPASAQGFDIETMSEAERAAFGEAVRAYLLDNPGVIAEAIEVLREREEAAQAAVERSRARQYRAALHDTSYAWAGGDTDGDVTVVEFTDYRCGFCKRAHGSVKEALERDGDTRLIVREYPILGDASVAAGRKAMAAYRSAPDLYPALNDALMAHQGDLDEATAYEIAESVGYDADELRLLAASDEIGAELEKTYRLGEVLGVRGTPTFIVEDRILRGAVSAARLIEEIEAARAEG